MSRLIFLGMVFTIMSIQTAYADLKLADEYIDSKQYDLAYKELKPLAEQGDAKAKFKLGLLYANGQGVPQDEKIACSYFESAANLGHSMSQYNTGQCYFFGKHGSQDISYALWWFNKSANKGNVEAMNKLGYIYQSDTNGRRDYQAALKWFRKSAEEGNSDGQFGLAYMYLRGEGVPKNKAEAKILFEKSAEQGNEDAINELAKLKAKDNSSSARYQPKDNSFSEADACRIVGRAAACGANTKSVDKLIRNNMGGTSASDLSRLTQYQSCSETVYSIAKTDLKNKTADFSCKETKKELQELTVFLKNFK